MLNSLLTVISAGMTESFQSTFTEDKTKLVHSDLQSNKTRSTRNKNEDNKQMVRVKTMS